MMATSYGALCTDFYVNQKLSLKMDLPHERETILHLYDRIRKSVPSMTKFRRYDGELSLESARRDTEYRWMSLKRLSIRAGHVNPQSMEEVYDYHRMLLEVVPYHLTISPLDVDHIELLFGFDLECKSNHDEVVYDALIANSPVADLLHVPGSKIMDVQPMYTISLDEEGGLQAYFEVRTRPKGRRGQIRRYRHEPISIFITLRQYGPLEHTDELRTIFDGLTEQIEILTNERLVPMLLTPISRQIPSSNA